MPYAVSSAHPSGDAKLEPLFFVHVRTGTGTHTISCGDAARALEAVERFRSHGYGSVRITNANGEPLAFDDLKRLAGT